MIRIIVPTCGNYPLLPVVKSLYQYSPDIPIQAIVIGNEAADKEEEHRRIHHVFACLQQWWPTSRCLHVSERLGYVAAIDWGWKLAEPEPDDYVAVLNDDVVIEGDWITPLMDALRERPGCQVGPATKCLGPDGLGYVAGQIAGRWWYLYLEGWCWMAMAETITRAGGIVDLGFEGSYCEDCDLSIRIAECGGRILQVAAPIRHIGHGSQTPEMMAQWAKNRQYLTEKWDLAHGGCRVARNLSK